MEHNEEIQKILLTQEKILGEIERVRFQQGIFESRFVSEQGTAERRNQGFDKVIEDNKKDVLDILYGMDRKSGLVVDMDRNTQTIKILKWVAGVLFVSVIGLLIKLFIN